MTGAWNTVILLLIFIIAVTVTEYQTLVMITDSHIDWMYGTTNADLDINWILTKIRNLYDLMT